MRKYVIYSVRYDRNGNLVNGQPCFHCVQFLTRIGIIKVVYSDNNGNLITTHIDKLNGTLSSGNRC